MTTGPLLDFPSIKYVCLNHQATQPINPTGENDTVFFDTYLGGITREQGILAKGAESFTGCIQDITVNGMMITEEDVREGRRDVEQVGTVT